jgi:hypothetical protein
MPLDSKKYDIALNNQQYRIRGYVKSEAPSFVPRVASGGQSETEFNMLLSKTLNSFTGGQLQRLWDDDESSFAIENLFPIYEDGTVYPVNAPVATGTLGTNRPIMSAYARTRDYFFYAWNFTTGGATQRISRIDRTGTIVTITVPANLSTIARPITDMVVWNNQLWVSGTDGATGSLYFMDITATTLNEITAGDAGTYFYKMVVWKSQLYGTNVIGTANHALSRYTGNTTTKSYAFLAATPNAAPSYDARLFIFNNRIHLSRNDGLFAYDGVQMAAIADLTAEVDDQNFLHACVLKGYLYYFMPDGFYRYNGSLIDKLYDISEIGMPVDMSVGKNRLWMTFVNSQASGSSRYDKSMGYDYSAVNTYDGRILSFNGKALYTYTRTSSQVKGGSPLLANEGELWRSVWWNDNLYIYTRAHPTSDQFILNTNEKALTGNKSWRIVTSIYNAGFAMVDKNLENIELVFDGVTSTDQTVTVEYRIAGFSGSTGWQTLGNISTVTKTKLSVFEQLPAGLIFRRIQFRIGGTTEASSGLSKVVLRYSLSPDFKWQWAFTLLAYGDDANAPLMLADGTQGTDAVSTLRGAIYAARDSDVPVVFSDIDRLDLNGAINAAVTTVVLNTTSLLKGSSGFIQIDSEIMAWSAKTPTNLTVVRGALGTTAATHADNAAVYPTYRVLITQIQGERIDPTDNGIDQAEDKSRSSEISLQIREI